ncbi:hypothetical protein [Halobacillus salinus]|uniref:DUF4181 domain-containing protein n=1 Tax=Halobacillus salinus TaxID=192814 RepID=A0A4Z0H168_9BACI|nr:hypothetical protein [Halobacillus salinus]TGB03729.1 hypothetical protein E4663_01620 [Halobacillus salinus]
MLSVSEEKENRTNKPLRIATNIILVALIIGIFKFFLDEDYTNDSVGWWLFILFWVVRSLYGLVNNLLEGHKWLTAVDLGIYLLITRFSPYVVE